MRRPWLTTDLLIGQLATSSLDGYRQDVEAYEHFCEEKALGLDATSLARWRTHLAHETLLSPHTISRRLAAVRRVAQEAAAQGDLDASVAEAFRRVQGISFKALRGRLKPPHGIV